MCYVDLQAPLSSCLPADVPCQKRYEEYETEHAKTVDEIDLECNTVVIPEGLTLALECFHNAKIVLWWMSVDNYYVCTGGADLDELKCRAMLHLVQSHYANVFCEEHFDRDKIMYLSDYINSAHGTFILPAAYRRDIVLYNPAKGYETLQLVKEYVDWLEWIPLSGLDLEQTIFMMQCAKLYVDFGNHPGKDRIPREAAANGCCVITNRKGSAAYQEDVPIPEKYKYAEPEKQLPEIDVQIRSIMKDYSYHIKDFEPYRDWIAKEKDKFVQDTTQFVEFLNRY